jgi:NAD+ diphosphatase
VTEHFELHELPMLSHPTVVHDELVRDDEARLRAGWQNAALVRVDPRGRVATRDGALLLAEATELGSEPVAEAVLLGHDRETDGSETDVWAVSVGWLPTPAGGGQPETVELRTGGATLRPSEAGMLATAAALLSWHATARFCALCGSPTEHALAGWSRRCTQNGHEEYPRTDPAVICLVHDGGDQVLLGRQPAWPPGRFSVLAGFVEAGESLEACVQREISEEVGVAVSNIRYLGSQPWPFPRSIMLGFHATADPAEQIVARDGEIAEAHWFTRSQVRESLSAGEWTSLEGSDTEQVPLLLPGSVSIARGMLESWANR